MASIRERVVAIVAEHFGVAKEQITDETRFDDLEADSLDSSEIVMELEEEFDVSIPDCVSDQFLTVGSVIRYLEGLPRVAD